MIPDHVPEVFPRGTTLLIGVVGEHDQPGVENRLVAMLAQIMSMRGMPLLTEGIGRDCLVAPPERGSVHVELYWIQV